MDTTKLIDRVRKILLTPKAEWQVVATESTSVGELYKSYIFILAAIPAVLQFIKLSVIGTDIMFAGRVRVGFMSGLTSMILGYALSLATVYVMALVVEALAPHFNGEKNRLQALKLVAYAYTAVWVAYLGLLVPGLWTLIIVAGVGYTIYLLYLGLPVTMKCSQDKAVGYVAATIVIGVVLSFVGSFVVGGIASAGSYGGSIFANDSDVKFDEDSPLGQLTQYANNLEKATKKLEVAQAFKDARAQNAALADTVGAVLGGQQVEALTPDRLKPFIPETLGGRARTNIAVERSKALGMQTSRATASFTGDTRRTINLEITDLGGAKGLLGLASFFDAEGEKQTESGYEKTFRDNDRLVSEKWDGNSSSGEYALVIGERFTVKLDGQAESIDELKAAMTELDLAGLESLRGEGVAQD